MGLPGFRQNETPDALQVAPLPPALGSDPVFFLRNPAPMWIYDLQTLRFLEVNDAAVEHYGYSRTEMLAMTIADIRPHEDHERLNTNLRGLPSALSHSDGWYHRKKDGSTIEVAITSHALVHEGRSCRLVLATDVSERKHAERTLSHMAHHDPLTDLPNRALLEERLAHALRRSKPLDDLVAVLFIDLDRFKRINDTYDHATGDSLLVAVGRRLMTTLRACDTLARPGGDEFIVVLENVANACEAAVLAQRVLRAFEDPFVIDDLSHHVSASIGMSADASEGTSPQVLIQHADMAMYQAKIRGGNQVQSYTSHLQVEASRRMRLERALREALKAGTFRIHFQPIVDTATGDIAGAEALVRWPLQSDLESAPSEFIPIAEESGLIVPLGGWILASAMTTGIRWHRAGYPLTLNVNVSPRQFDDPGFVDFVAAACTSSGFDPRFLALEITENAVVEVDEPTLAAMQRLRALGVRLVVDDFGTGYSSLHYLKRLPIAGIKIDRSFVNAIATDPFNEAIVEAVITMGRKLAIETVAEGIESQTDFERLRTLGCNRSQGFYFSRPICAERFFSLIVERRASRRAEARALDPV